MSRLLGWLVNPPGGVSDAELRAAVSGRVVVVTGASYGLGEAVSRRLGAAGARVLLVARTASRLDEVAAAIVAAGGDAEALPADLTDPASVDALADRIASEHDRIDIFINNAGKSIRRSLERSLDRPHDYTRTIDVNYLGPVRLTLRLIPLLRDGGHVVNVGTIGTRVPPSPRWGAYQASKGAFDVFLRSITIELAQMGVATTSVYMALIHTRMSAPTASLRGLPGQTPAAAADVIARALVRRPAVVSPWWAGVADAATTVAGRRAWDGVVGLIRRCSADDG